MGFLDLILLIFGNLGRRKARVALTAIGVIIGTAAVVVLVSLGIGLQKSANQQLAGIGDLTQINVYPGYPQNPVDGPVRAGPGGETLPIAITNQTLADIAAIPGVVAVIPRDYSYGGGPIKYNRLENYPSVVGVGTSDLANMGLTAMAGTTALERGTAVLGYTIPNNFFDPTLRPGQEPPPPPDLLNETLKLTMIKWDQEGQETRKTVQFRVAGILNEKRGEPDWMVYVPIEDITLWNEWYMGKRINREKDGYNSILVRVEDAGRTIEVTDTIKALGYNADTPQAFVQGINSFYLVMQVIFGGVGAIALLVAAIGIANTMAMAILERTREIGLMKAVGATNRDVLSIFLGEAAGIGLIGGLGGVLVGWSAGQIINVLGQVYMAGQATQNPGMPPTTIAVSTPLWLLGFALVFATLVGLISGIYPALRAATLIPVQALKYE